MNSEYIHTLLKKYWNCETSVQEEEELKSFFSGSEVPRELKKYIPLFSYINEQSTMMPGSDFEEKLNDTIRENVKESRYITIRVFTPMLRVAATLLLIFGLGMSLFFISKQYKKPYFAETYHDPNAAIKDATYALIKVSEALQASEEASFQIVHFIDELEIDWSAIDSLSNTLPRSTDKESPLEVENAKEPAEITGQDKGSQRRVSSEEG